MINELLGLSNDQERLNVSSDASSPGTTGVWASHPVCIDTPDFRPCTAGSPCRRCAVVLDVEGVHSALGDESTDHALVLVSLAMSDLTIFNTDHKLDMADLLEAVDALTLSEVYSDTLALPHLLFTVQKFTLNEGSLAATVENMPGSHKAMQLVRDTLGRFSGGGTPIMTLPPAVADSTLWNQLDSGDIEFDEPYLDALADVRAHVVNRSRSWIPASRRLNLIEGLISVLLTNPTPTTESLVTQISRTVTADVEADLITKVSTMIPVHGDVFKGQVTQLIEDADRIFHSRCKHCSFNSTVLLQRCVKMNFDAAASACVTDVHSFLSDLYKVKRRKDYDALQRAVGSRTSNCWADPARVQDVFDTLDTRGKDLATAQKAKPHIGPLFVLLVVFTVISLVVPGLSSSHRFQLLGLDIVLWISWYYLRDFVDLFMESDVAQLALKYTATHLIEIASTSGVVVIAILALIIVFVLSRKAAFSKQIDAIGEEDLDQDVDMIGTTSPGPRAIQHRSAIAPFPARFADNFTKSPGYGNDGGDGALQRATRDIMMIESRQAGRNKFGTL
ncbi:hypothetical protein J8273_2217 [Carpediemonas membranifera]|uniref:Uncharacterized protein n=1 Tax=Carpediemonas membranifera TaxID=201153 RepID=A0A8J6B7I8_9EUKA|nr:hypothetical protein J8273_2217 [Carpediemonas membranifera]|eukprot:KAG9395884.1 hypothetical protein J8273_2217 [Carpediemonas membranifera]